MENNASLQGLMTFKRFLQLTGETSDNITFIKGKGRSFVSTKAGVLFVMKNYDKAKPAYVTMAGPDVKTLAGDSLEGTLWLVNSGVTADFTLDANGQPVL